MKLPLLLAVGTLAACSGIATRYDYDAEAQFDGLSTYAWIESSASPELSELDVRRTTTAVDRVLAAGGYTPDAEAPDFLVAVQLGTHERVRVTEYGASTYSRYGGLGTRSYDVDEYEEGTLLIDVVDPGSEQLIWRGRAEGRLYRHPSPEERTARIEQAVAQVLAASPPS